MKKSLLALAVLATTVSANAATVYDKDGVSLKADGRVQAVIYNGANKLAGESDSTLQNSARFGIGGSTKVGIVKLTGYSQWADLIYEQALLADQGALKDPSTFVKAMNTLLLG